MTVVEQRPTYSGPYQFAFMEPWQREGDIYFTYVKEKDTQAQVMLQIPSVAGRAFEEMRRSVVLERKLFDLVGCSKLIACLAPNFSVLIEGEELEGIAKRCLGTNFHSITQFTLADIRVFVIGIIPILQLLESRNLTPYEFWELDFETPLDSSAIILTSLRKMIHELEKNEEKLTPNVYLPPEVWRGSRPYNQTGIMVWVLGCFLIKLLMRKPLFEGNDLETMEQVWEKFLGSEIENRNALMRALWPFIPDKERRYFHLFCDFLRKCLRYDASERFQLDAIENHPFIQSCAEPLSDYPYPRIYPQRKFYLAGQYYVPERKVGRGTYGVTVLCNTHDHAVVVKFPRTFSGDNQFLFSESCTAALQNECRILQCLHGLSEEAADYFPCIEAVDYTHFDNPLAAGHPAESIRTFAVVYECLGPSLSDSIKARLPFNLETIRGTAFHVLEGIHRMHAAGVCHHDIKPGNILSDSHHRVKIIDFGLARIACAGNEILGTMRYMAPESILQLGKHTQAVDIWGFGCVLAELYCGEPLFPAKDFVSMITAFTKVLGPIPFEMIADSPRRTEIVNGDVTGLHALEECIQSVPELNEELPLQQYFLKLLRRIFCYTPDQRPTAQALMDDPFFKTVQT